MNPRMNNPAAVIPDAMPAILNLFKTTKQGGVPDVTMELVHLRVSQVNGCSACVDSGPTPYRTGSGTRRRSTTTSADWRRWS